MSSPETAPGPAADSAALHRLPRATLTREAVVAAAAEVLDEEGVEGLTMRAVARRMDAGTMSLYRHVGSRDELLDLVIARLVADVPERRPTGDWREDLAAVARDVRAVLLRRPNLTVLMTSRSGPGVGSLAVLDRSLGILRAGGFAPADAVHANHALGNFVAGAALWEAVGFAGATGEERARQASAAAESVARVPADEYPNVAWAAGALFAGTADGRFEAGLRALLDGFEAMAGRGQPG